MRGPSFEVPCFKKQMAASAPRGAQITQYLAPRRQALIPKNGDLRPQLCATRPKRGPAARLPDSTAKDLVPIRFWETSLRLSQNWEQPTPVPRSSNQKLFAILESGVASDASGSFVRGQIRSAGTFWFSSNCDASSALACFGDISDLIERRARLNSLCSLRILPRRLSGRRQVESRLLRPHPRPEEPEPRPTIRKHVQKQTGAPTRAPAGRAEWICRSAVEATLLEKCSATIKRTKY